MVSTREPGAWAFERGQRDVLEHIASGSALPRLLSEITQLIETQQAGMLCSILLLDRQHGRVRHGAAPSLPAGFVRAIDGAKIGPQAGSCGTAAYLGERVIVEDIETHPVWVDYRDLARSFGLRACWSSPHLLERARRAGDVRDVLPRAACAGAARARVGRARHAPRRRRHRA